MGYRREGRWGRGGTWQSKLKLTRSIEQMHLVMIVNKHATKYSMQVPSLPEVVERDTVPLETVGPFAANLPRSICGFDLRFHLGKTSSNSNKNLGFT